MPESVQSFLPTVSEEKAKDQKKNNKEQQPEFVGPRGHQEPK